MNLRIVRWIDAYLGIPLAYLVRFTFFLSRYRPKAKSYKNILLVKFWGIGNVIMLLPAARALKKAYPDAQIDFLTLSGNKEVALLSGIFNDVYTLDITSALRFAFKCLTTIFVLRKRGYDLIVDFEQFARFSALYCAFIASKDTVGFGTRNQHRHFLYRRHVTYNNAIHTTKSFYNLAELLQAEHQEYLEPVRLDINNQDRNRIEAVLGEYKIALEAIMVILHIGTSGNFILRRWPVEYFALLADKLADAFGVKVIFTGLAGEVALADSAISRMQRKDAAVNVAGRFNLGELTAFLLLSDLVISADTAAVHLASALSVPVVGLYGPNTPLLYGPWGKNSIWFYRKQECSPCITNYNAKINKCRHPKGQGACMKEISAEEVFLGIKDAFFGRGSRFRLQKIKNHAKVVAFSREHSAK